MRQQAAASHCRRLAAVICPRPRPRAWRIALASAPRRMAGRPQSCPMRVLGTDIAASCQLGSSTFIQYAWPIDNAQGSGLCDTLSVFNARRGVKGWKVVTLRYTTCLQCVLAQLTSQRYHSRCSTSYLVKRAQQVKSLPFGKCTRTEHVSDGVGTACEQHLRCYSSRNIQRPPGRMASRYRSRTCCFSLVSTSRLSSAIS